MFTRKSEEVIFFQVFRKGVKNPPGLPNVNWIEEIKSIWLVLLEIFKKLTKKNKSKKDFFQIKITILNQKINWFDLKYLKSNHHLIWCFSNQTISNPITLSSSSVWETCFTFIAQKSNIHSIKQNKNELYSKFNTPSRTTQFYLKFNLKFTLTMLLSKYLFIQTIRETSSDL